MCPDDMEKKIKELEFMVKNFKNAPTLEEMPKNSLVDKGINGPTGAHKIEELHTPLNFSYIATTTGSTAFQNITGITEAELPLRISASKKALELAGAKNGDTALFCYPPLVNVFYKQALEEFGIKWSFLERSTRDAFLYALCKNKPKIVFGESSFLRAALEDCKKLELLTILPKNVIVIAAGTPLDLELLDVARRTLDAKVYDLYGCQEFGWITLNGVPLRSDISLVPVDCEHSNLLVGGLHTGDCFNISEKGHICDARGKIITYSRKRVAAELETTILASTAKDISTVQKLARTILRIKSKIVRISPDCILGAERTAVSVASFGSDHGFLVEGHEKTAQIDALLKAQLEYQSASKKDLTWNKTR